MSRDLAALPPRASASLSWMLIPGFLRSALAWPSRSSTARSLTIGTAVALALAAPPGLAEKVGRDDFVDPVRVEGWEGLIDPASMRPVREPVPPVGFQSGIGWVFPDPGEVQGSFTVADFAADTLAEPLVYDLGTNGTATSPSDLASGTAFAASRAPPEVFFVFTLPEPTQRAGMYVSAFNAGTVRLRAFDSDVNVLAEEDFVTQPLPLDADNFVGLQSPVAFTLFGVTASANFLFDDLIFEVPEPSAATQQLAVVLGLWIAAARRRNSR